MDTKSPSIELNTLTLAIDQVAAVLGIDREHVEITYTRDGWGFSVVSCLKRSRMNYTTTTRVYSCATIEAAVDSIIERVEFERKGGFIR